MNTDNNNNQHQISTTYNSYNKQKDIFSIYIYDFHIWINLEISLLQIFSGIFDTATQHYTDQFCKSVGDKRPTFPQVLFTIRRKQNLERTFLKQSMWVALFRKLWLFPAFWYFQQFWSLFAACKHCFTHRLFDSTNTTMNILIKASISYKQQTSSAEWSIRSRVAELVCTVTHFCLLFVRYWS